MNRRKKKNTRANLYRGGDGKSYYEANKRRRMSRYIKVGSTILITLLLALSIMKISGRGIFAQRAYSELSDEVISAQKPDIDVELLTVNEYSRPGTALEKVNGIVVHYTANPGTTAQQNRDYFEGLAQSGETHASSHFVIGISGEIIQCIPCNEIAYASNERNADTISIECCIPDDTGKFTDATYGSLVHLVTWLMGRYDLTTDDVIRHYDVTGKACPKYYVENEAAWEQFKSDLVDYIETNGIAKTEEIQ